MDKQITDSFVYQGVWYIPSDSPNECYGTLVYNPTHGGELEIFIPYKETETDPFPDRSEAIILGVTKERNLITLIDCKRKSFNSIAGKIQILKFDIPYIIVGGHIKNLSDLVFNRAIIKYNNLDIWLDRFDFANQGDIYDITDLKIEYNRPKNVPFSINEALNGQFEFHAAAPNNSDSQKFSIIQEAVLTLIFANATEIKDLLKEIYVFTKFLKFATLENTYITSIILANNEQTFIQGYKLYFKEMSLFFGQYGIEANSNSKNTINYLFTYNEISDTFEDVIRKWYILNEKIRPVIGFLMDSINVSVIEINTFLNIVQALEIYHRNFKKNYVIPKSEHKARVNNILKSVENQHKDWLKEAINYSNEPRLKDRLCEILHVVSEIPTLDKMISDKNAFIVSVKDSRNYYTHYDASGKKTILKDLELALATKKLQAILIALLLMDLGLTNEEVNNYFEKQKYGHFRIIMPHYWY
ncbi:ApeA N-terminal domain 1-containing protein [Runella slithyformis]|uniref:ApeA N-terminal domain-containing protein n=1 Tax=Runella slithyformis (strain ATCC 29530 / DSM 19594 / LMG 11500 / NCIMB 11436 / LSU 4) TaxID=761193 RepID=A0A7U4E3W0_RUNSL|nr:HEPN domain-containing protein [Runella slithyformis]AEI46803.1 hypothetical protein Runsl_0351 [Runella slithyformis DSM 19594]